MAIDGHVRLWNAVTGAALGQAFDDPPQVLYVAFSGDGTRLIAACDDKVVRIWDVASKSLVAGLELESGSMDVAIGPDGTRVATASADGVARVWDVPQVLPRVLAAGPGYDAMYSPDGTRIATTSTNGELALWSATGALQATLKPQIGVGNPVFDHAGRRFAMIAVDGSAQLGEVAPATLRAFPKEMGKDPSGGEGPETLIGHVPALGAFSPDGRRFATMAPKHTVRIWDTASLEVVVPPLAHDATLVMVRFSPDGRCVVTASVDGTARIWSADTGALQRALPHSPGIALTGAVFSPDGARIVTTGVDAKVRIWNASSGQLQSTLSGHAALVIAAAFSPDGTLLLSNSQDNSARIWDVATGKLAVPPLEHESRVESAAFSPDGARVVTASNKIAQIWDVKSGRLLAAPFVHPDYLRAAVFSPDGGSLLTVASDAVRIWNVGLDTRTLEDWLRAARDGSFPQLAEALDRLAPASRIVHP
ncbi:MAG: hypothetical protein E6J90_35200 [Deltaproteobacteria bacterium]|nr:MAG: hypothetical protein E6J90_35200 [Deltaproteobacteria bacterium]